MLKANDMNTHQETVERAKADFLRAKEMLAQALATKIDLEVLQQAYER